MDMASNIGAQKNIISNLRKIHCNYSFFIFNSIYITFARIQKKSLPLFCLFLLLFLIFYFDMHNLAVFLILFVSDNKKSYDFNLGTVKVNILFKASHTHMLIIHI